MARLVVALLLVAVGAAVAEAVVGSSQAFRSGQKFSPASFLEAGANGAPHRLCVRDTPNVVRVMKSTCCAGLKCGFANGVCCEGRTHCCPSGTVCVTGDPGTPPGCLHVLEAIKKGLAKANANKASSETPTATVHATSAMRFESVSEEAAAAAGVTCGTPKLGPCNVQTQPPKATPAPDMQKAAAAAVAATQATNYPKDQYASVKLNPLASPCACEAAAPCPCKAAPLPIKRVIYEDSMAPIGRNAFEQFKVEQTVAHADAVAKGNTVVQQLLRKTLDKVSKGGKHALGPLPPAVSNMKIGSPDAVGSVKNALSFHSDSTQTHKLGANVPGTFTAEESPDGNPVYNLPGVGRTEISATREGADDTMVRTDHIESQIKPAKNYS